MEREARMEEKMGQSTAAGGLSISKGSAPLRLRPTWVRFGRRQPLEALKGGE